MARSSSRAPPSCWWRCCGGRGSPSAVLLRPAVASGRPHHPPRGVIGVTFIGATVLWSVIPTHRGDCPIAWDETWWATAGRLVGVRTVALNLRVDAFLYPALLAIGLGLASVALVLAFRPVVDRHRSTGRTDTTERVADIVRRLGTERSTTRRPQATSRPSSNATVWWRTRSTAVSAWCPPTRYASPRSVTSYGPCFAVSRTTAAGRWPCSGPVKSGSVSLPPVRHARAVHR